MRLTHAAAAAIATAALIATGVTRAAQADGLSSRGDRAAAVGGVASPGCNTRFGGFYAGGHLASVDYQSDITDHDFATWGGSHRQSDSSWGGGVQIGYNFQRCNTVFGIEADIAWLDSEKSDRISYYGGALYSTYASGDLTSKVEYFGTIRTRSGLAFDNLFLFATGGLAYANFKHSLYDTTGSYGVDTSDVRWGWVVGAGVEYALTDTISLNSDFLWARFDDDSYTYGGYRYTVDEEILTIRTGLNFRLGGERRLEAAATTPGPLK